MILTKTLKQWAKKLLPGQKRSGPPLHATLIPRSEHSISRKSIPKNALNVLYRLHNNNYEAYLVGGCVRDLLLGLRPKDFDVTTDAKPEQVKRLFSNCRLIGRRFRLAHVYYGHEIIEVATFRAGPSKESPKHQTSESGMLLRDNVFGTIDEDAVRRDFTVNALYYRISDFTLVDFCQGMQDIQDKLIRLIGEPELRYREDPVRMLRAARFAAKLNFTLHEATQAPIAQLAPLLKDVPSARLFEECLKLFLSGHGLASLRTLRSLGLLEHLLPASTDFTAAEWRLIETGLEDTDHRIQTRQTTSPGYFFAVLLWPMFTDAEAIDSIFRELNGNIAVPKRISLITAGIWELQSRLENVKQHQVNRLLDHPGFRAAFDFLKLRSLTLSPELSSTVQWWEAVQTADDDEYDRLCEQLPKQSKRRGRRRSKQKNHEM